MRPTSGWRHPRNPGLGVDVAGIVTEVGTDVSEFRVGDAVFGPARGSLAEAATARAEYLAPIPAGVTPAEAAAVPLAGLTALQALRDKGQLEAGGRVLILGAAGGVGHYAVQLARSLGVGRVVASCSGRNAEWIAGLGADRVRAARESRTCGACSHRAGRWSSSAARVTDGCWAPRRASSRAFSPAVSARSGLWGSIRRGPGPTWRSLARCSATAAYAASSIKK